jgi:hypothetical protein
MKKWLFGLLVAATLTSSAQELAEGPFNQLIIRSAMLINGNGAPPLGPVDVVVEQDKITEVRVVGYPGVEINEKRRPALKPGGREINAEGMYLLPGFVDMHGHIGGVAQGADWDYVFSLWLAHGITTVREPSGRGLEWALDLKKKAERNEIIAFLPTPGSVPAAKRSPPPNRHVNGCEKTLKKEQMESSFLVPHQKSCRPL